MRGGVVALVGAVVLLAAVGVARANEPRELDDRALRHEMTANRLLRRYVERNGLPDVAESSFLSTVPPWDDHVVTLYYLDSHREIAFARAFILGQPDVTVYHHERTLSDDEVATLAPRARRHGSPADRAEASALRAEQAAGRVELAADRADRAAQRAEAIATKLESHFKQHLRK